jgi:hypothetical protein
MAGQLTIDTLKASSGVLATQNGMTGIAKAWVLFDGTTSTIAASFNVSSIFKNATGNWNINFTTAMPNTNYCLSGMASSYDTTDPSGRNLSVAANTNYGTPVSLTTSTVRVLFGYAGALSYDAQYIAIIIHGA